MNKSCAYYNEFDKNAAAWLRELINEGLIAHGEVDERSIVDVEATDLKGYTQHHFFAGIGGWSYALRLANWPDELAVWSASLPCQPFSAAGKGLGKADERHLLPRFLELVRQCKPRVIFGEQVSSAIRSTGIRAEIKDLQLLQKREAYIRVLSELQRSRNEGLHIMPLFGEVEKEREKEAELRFLSEMEDGKQGEGVGECCGSSSERKGNDIGYNFRLGAREDKSWDMRGNRDSVRLGDAESVECSFSGSDRQQSWVSEIEYSRSDLCPECDDEYLGRTKDFRSIEWDHETAQRQILGVLRETVKKIEGTNTSGWLDDLQANMEAEGYAVGHCVLGAHSVGAPHVRQRLYWVATNDGSASRICDTACECQTWQSGQGIEKQKQTGRSGFSHWGLGNSQSKRCREEGKFSIGFKEWTADAGPDSCMADTSIDWIYCRDDKYRPIKSGIQPLVARIPEGMVYSGNPSESANQTQEARQMRLKGYGNAIVPQVAAQFICAFIDVSGIN